MRDLIQIASFFSGHPLTRDSRAKAWLRFARWQLLSRLHHEIVWQRVAGQKLAVRRGMKCATGNIYAGLHEFPGMMFFLH